MYMRIKPLLLLVLVPAICGCVTNLGVPARALPRNAVPQRIAVASFENRSGFDGQWKIGSGMADLLVSELVATRNFVVLERGRLDTVVNEIRRQKNEMFRQEGRVDDGRLDNARYLIRGVITDFSQTSGGSLWMAFRRVFIGSGGYTARVGLTLTIIDVESGVIVDSVQSSGRAKAGSAYAQADYKGVQFGGKAFFRTPLGKATSSAIRQGLHEIVRKVPRQHWQPMVADVMDGKLVINGGRDRGIRRGQFFDVREAGTPVTDPQTGDLLDVLPGGIVGKIEIAQVRDSSAKARVVEGGGFARGQLLERNR